MLNDKIEKAINDQVNAELYSSYLYLSMSSYFSSKNLAGAAQWMKIQALEELYHAMKMYAYVDERGGRPVMEVIVKPPIEWDSPLAAFEAVLEHERMVTGRINDLVSLAMAEKDHASTSFFQWFVDEQVEEEASADEMVQKLRLAGEDGAGLLMIDQEMARRVMKVPPDIKIPLVMAAGA